MDDAEEEHGTLTAYTARKCRCAACRKNWADYMRQRRAERKLEPIPEDKPHGSASTYGNWGCRCRPCTEAFTKASARRKAQV